MIPCMGYFSIWRDGISNAREISGIKEDLMEVGFPLKLGIPVNSDDFRTTQNETIIVGTSPVILPTYILEKDLTPFIGSKRLPHATTELERISKKYDPPPNTNMPIKFSTLDGTFLLGALTPETLVQLVVQCGFVLQNGSQEILAQLGLKFFAICEDSIFQERCKEDLVFALGNSGYNLQDDIRIEQPHQQFVPIEKRRIKIRNDFIMLPPYVFITRIIPTGLIANIVSRTRPYWITLGAQSATDLMELIEYSGLDKLILASTNIPNKTGRQPISEEDKIFVWNRDGGRCVRCGSQANLEFDHVIPIAMGGSNTARNLQLLCEKCNRVKGAKISQ